MCEEGGGGKQLKWIEDKRCMEWEWGKEHKRHKNKRCNGCVQEDSAAKSYITVMRLVSCC
jgi:hypothetical protein